MNFKIEVDHAQCEVRVTVRVALKLVDVSLSPPLLHEVAAIERDRGRRGGVSDEEVQALRTRRLWEKMVAWRDAVERAWSNRYNFVRTTSGGPSGCEYYRILVTVAWLDADDFPDEWQGGGNESVDQVVTVWPVLERESTGAIGLYEPSVHFAHELGHFLGTIDEYDGTCDGCPDRPIVDRSIMNDPDDYPEGVFPHHFTVIRLWMATRLCAGFDVERVRPGLSAGHLGLDVLVNTDIPEFFYELDC